MRKSSILLLTTVAALGSSFLVPVDAFASNHGFAHAAQVSRVHASTGGARTASVGSNRSTGFQRPTSSGTVASGSITQPRFGSANVANRTFGRTTTPTNTPQPNKLASNGTQPNTKRALANVCSGVGAPATCFLNQGKGVAGTNNQPTPKTTGGPGDPCSKPPFPKSCTATNVPPPAPPVVPPPVVPPPVVPPPVNPPPVKPPPVTPPPVAPPVTPPVAGNHPHPFPGGHPFPGRFPVVIGAGHGPFVGGPFVGGLVAVRGSVAPVAVAPVASAGSALPPVTAPSAPRPLAPSCLNKTYLQTGVVMFRDVCSQEWAINSSNVTNPAPANSACLSKENPQNGVVLFKDNCTSEWAMNPQPANNQAQAN